MNEKKNFDYKKLHPFKWYILENFPFLEDSIDVLTNYQLFCKLGEMYNKEVDAINTLGIQVEGLTDWFDDLDVQEEINNKLDEMAESGELEEIIASYLNTKAILCFDTVSDMIESENLIDGSYAKTLGFYNPEDGGSSVYKIRTITNDDVVDGMTIIEMTSDNSLIAELQILNKELNINQLGAKPDGETDNKNQLQKAINIGYQNNVKIKFTSGTYCFSGIIEMAENQNGITMEGNNQLTTIIKALTNTSQIDFKNFLRCNITFIRFMGTGTEEIPLVNIEGASNLSSFRNCGFTSNMGVNINQSAYLTFEECNFSRVTSLSADSAVNYLLKTASSLSEYLYLKNCYFDGFQSTADCSPVQILGGHNIYIENCDFCNWYGGKAIQLGGSASVKDISITNSTFVRNNEAIRIQCDQGVSSVKIDGNDFILLNSSVENYIINVARTSGTPGVTTYLYGQNNIDANYNLSSKTMFASSGFIRNGKLVFTSINESYPQYDTKFPLYYEMNIWLDKTVSLSGGATEGNAVISSNSPYYSFNLPTLKWYKYNGATPTSVELQNTYGGNLQIHFVFPNANAYSQFIIRLVN